MFLLHTDPGQSKNYNDILILSYHLLTIQIILLPWTSKYYLALIKIKILEIVKFLFKIFK